MKRRLVHTLAALAGLALLGAVGATPRYIEEMRIGGGFGDSVDGGTDLEKNGNIATNGSVSCSGVTAAQGSVTAGVDTTVRGVITAWDGTGGNAPGCLRLVAPNGTPYYFFAPDDGTGLRVHTALPASNNDGQWLKARTVTDLSAPPPIGATTPNSGKFTTLETTGSVALGNVAGVAHTLSLGCGSALPSTMTVDHWTTLSAASGGWGVIGLNAYIQASGAAAVKYNHVGLGYAGVGFFPGVLRFYVGSGATTADAPLTSVAVLDGSGNLTANGTLTANSLTLALGAKIGGAVLVGSSSATAEAKLHVRAAASGFTGSRNWRMASGGLIETNDDTILELQGGASKSTEIWFGDPDSENAGRVRYRHDTDALELWTSGASRFSLDANGKGTFAGDIAVNGGDITSTASTLALTPAAGGSVTVNGDLNVADGKSVKGAFKASSGAAGVSGTIVIPKLTTGGTNGSITVADGLITAFTNPT